MKKIILLTLIILPKLAFCAWTEIGFNQELNLTIYANFDQIKIDKNYKFVESLYNYKTVNSEFNKPHLSELEFNEFDCQKKLVRSPKIIWYTGQKATGRKAWETENKSWRPIPRNSAYWEISEKICS